MKNAFYFTLKALFVLKLFKFLSRLFDHAEKTVISQVLTTWDDQEKPCFLIL